MEDLHQNTNGESGPADQRHDPLPEPLQQTADALRASAVSSSTLDSATKSRQRAYLMSLSPSSAKTDKSAAMPPVVTPPKPASPERNPTKRPWFPVLGGLVAVALVAVIAVAAVGRLSKTPVLTPVTTVARLLIPAVHAGDAFSVTPDHSDSAGVETTSGFTVASKVDVGVAQFQQALRILPAVDLTVERKDDGNFHLQPKQPLQPGVVYRLALATSVQNTDGSSQIRDFTWAMQTKNDLRVLSTIPGDQTSGVPTNTGIEFKFTYPNVVDLKPYFSISPNATGTFEQHGRSIAFVPSSPLAAGTKYEVTLKKDIHVVSSTLALSDDVHVRFETQSPLPPVQQPLALYFNEFNEAVPGKDIQLATTGYNGSDALAATKVTVTGYALSTDDARRLIQARLTIPDWAPYQASQYQDYKQVAHNQAFQLTVTPTRPNPYGAFLVSLPKIDRAGTYIVRFQPQGGDETWITLQVTNNAVYSMADPRSMLLWVVNPSTQRPLSNLPVHVSTTNVMTDADGVARFPLNAALATSTTSTPSGTFLVEVGAPGDVFFLIENYNNGVYSPYTYGYGSPINTNDWSYLFIDRPIYHPTDAMSMYGFVQDRDSHQGAGALSVRIEKSGGWWSDYFGRQKVYQEQTLQTDAGGHFQNTFSWADMAPGYYAANVYVNDVLVASRYFEVRDFVKPAYSITATTEKPTVFAGDKINGSIDVAFYDGTPLAHSGFDVQIDAGGYGASNDMVHVTTDDSGHADYSFQTTKLPCDTGPAAFASYRNCPSWDYRSITVRSSQGEEADIVGSTSVQVMASNLSLTLMPSTTGTQAQIDVKTTHVDLSKDDQLGDVWGQHAVTGAVVGHSWKQVNQGTYYDFFSKQTYPRYSYEQVDDAPTTFSVTTDASGHAQYGFKMEQGKWYSVYAISADDRGQSVITQQDVAIGWYDYASDAGRSYYYSGGQDDETPQLSFVPDTENDWSSPTFKQDDQVTVRYQHGNHQVDLSQTSGILFVTASRGIRTVHHEAGSTFQFPFDQNLMPNAVVRAIVFEDNHFVMARRDLGLDLDTRTLNVTSTPDQKQYLPGGNIKIHVTVTKKDGGQPAAHATIAYAAIDKALEGVTYLTEESPVGSLYGYVSDGILLETSSHQNGLQNLMSSGAEKGGGGGGGDMASVRRIFKDTAAFGMLTTDDKGEADVVFKAPDNLTTWRVQVVGVTNDVLAGENLVNVPVTKPLFVDSVIPNQLLTADKPVIKLRAYGSALKTDDTVAFTVDAPTLGIQGQSVNAKAFTPVYVGIDHLVPGHHLITLHVTSPQGTDAIERSVDVADTHYTKDEQKITDAVPGATLPDIGTPQTDLTVSSKAQASLLPYVRDLSYNDWSPRVDAQIVGKMMKKMMVDVFHVTDTSADADQSTLLNNYLDDAGGVRLLPYSSSDPELSAEVAVTAPELFDQEKIKGYFYGMIDDQSSSRELQISALAGLAALHEPVLLQLQSMATQTDLTWRERLTIARGLMSAGDQDGARAQLNILLQSVIKRGNVTSLGVSTSTADVYEATADGAALAAQLSNPEAENMERFINENWSNEAFPLLARARYLAVVVPRTPVSKVDLTYTIDGKTEKTMDLSEDMVQTITVTSEEAKAFRVVRVDGPVAISFIKRVPGRPTSKPEVSVSRSYTSDHPLNQLQDGDIVHVNLTVDIKQNAQDGCYSLRDYLPAGMQPVVSWNSYYGYYGNGGDPATLWYPYDVSGNQVSYIVCKEATDKTLTYLARVTSRGSYVAEAPSLQHLEHPDVSAIGTDQTIIIQ